MGFRPSFFRHAAVAFLLAGAGCAEPDPAGGVAAGAVRGEAEGEVEDVPYVGYLGGWSVTAGRPVFVDENHIRGSASFAGPEGETRGGGACLVADLHKKFPCETQDDCFAALGAPPPGGFHYCVGVNGDEDSDHRFCWTRPSAAGCIRGTRLPGETALTTVAPVRVNGRMVNWITVARLSASDPSLFIHVTSFKLEE